MTKPLELVQFGVKTDGILTACLKDGKHSEAASALRFVLACPASAPVVNADFIRVTCRKVRGILEAMAKKATNGITSSGVSVSQLKAACTCLSVADALTFPATANGVGARSRWSNPLVNVENIPTIARAFLWPDRFSLADHGVATDALCDAADALLAVVSDFEANGHKSHLLGFEVTDFAVGAAFVQALQAALPVPRETMKAGGKEYVTATAEHLSNN